jgi:hypothetical protein
MEADRTLLITGKYYLLSAVALAVGVAIAAAGVAVAPGDTLAVLAPLSEENVSGFLAQGTGAYLILLGAVVAVVGRAIAMVYTVGSGLEAALEERAEAIERDLNRELRALRADLTEDEESGGGRRDSASTESTGGADTGRGPGERPAGVDGEGS